MNLVILLEKIKLWSMNQTDNKSLVRLLTEIPEDKLVIFLDELELCKLILIARNMGKGFDFETYEPNYVQLFINELCK